MALVHVVPRSWWVLPRIRRVSPSASVGIVCSFAALGSVEHQGFADLCAECLRGQVLLWSHGDNCVAQTSSGVSGR